MVANLPYYITTPIIMGPFENEVPVESITVMVQRSCGPYAAGPGNKDYGALSLAVQHYASTLILKVANVPPRLFSVQSESRISGYPLYRHQEKPLQVQDEKLMFNIIRCIFPTREV